MKLNTRFDEETHAELLAGKLIGRWQLAQEADTSQKWHNLYERLAGMRDALQAVDMYVAAHYLDTLALVAWERDFSLNWRPPK